MNLLSEKHSPKPFAHPAFSRPENEWMKTLGYGFPIDFIISKKRVSHTHTPECDVEVYLLGDGVTTCTRVSTAKNGVDISTYSCGDLNEVNRHERGFRVWTEFRIKDKLIKRETVFRQKDIGINDKCYGSESENDELEEVWYSMFKNKSEPVAIRRTKAGVLSCDIGPAVVIRHFDPCTERQEFWKDGVLSKVRIVSDQEIIVEERWEKGVVQTREWIPRSTEEIPSGVSVLLSYSNQGSEVWKWNIPAKPIEVAPAPEKVPAKKVSILTLEDAKKMLLERSIEKFNSKVIKRMCKGKRFLNINFADDVRNEMKNIIEQAGYAVVKLPPSDLRTRVSLA